MATDVAAGLPQVDLQPGSVVTVTLSDAGSQITALNIHGFQRDTSSATTPDLPASPAWLPA
jgi:hypothetical protein